MGLAVKEYIEPSGQRNAVILESETGIPKFWPTLYCTSQLRTTGKSQNTRVAILRSLIFLYRWAELRKLDLEARISSEKGFTHNEIDSLVTLLRSRIEDLPDPLASNSNVVPLNRSNKPKTDDIWRELEERPKQVAAATFNDRLFYCGAYLAWLANALSDQDPAKSPEAEVSISDIGVACQKRLRSMKSTESNTAFDESRDIQSSDIRKILNLIKPESPTNPWASREVRIKNFAIVVVLLDTGFRSGELGSLKLSDIISSPKKRSRGLKVKRRQGSKDDPRLRQPSAKTAEREVPLSEGAFQALDHYVQSVRNVSPGASKTSYLFLSDSNRSRGRPLSSYNSITDKIRDLTGIDLTPHRLRHTATWRYCVQQKKAGRKWVDFVGQLCEKFGWSSPDSPSVRHYAKRFIREEMFASSIGEQDKLDVEVLAGIEAAKKDRGNGE